MKIVWEGKIERFTNRTFRLVINTRYLGGSKYDKEINSYELIEDEFKNPHWVDSEHREFHKEILYEALNQLPAINPSA